MKIVPRDVGTTVAMRVILAWAGLSLLAGTASCFTLSCLSRETTAYCADISRAQPIGFHDIAFHLENNMAVMMVLMVVLLVAAGPHGHMGSHGTNEPSTQSSQPHEHDATKPGVENL